MRDLGAIILALILLAVAFRMATSLSWHRRNYARLRQSFLDNDQLILAEIPVKGHLQFFTEDYKAFYWEERIIPKAEIRSARILINGTPMSISQSTIISGGSLDQSDISNDQDEKTYGDQWDVAIEIDSEIIVIKCGAIRERVSQELARRIFEATKKAIEAQST